MRIRHYRQVDIPTILQIWQLAAEADGLGRAGTTELEHWLQATALEAVWPIFIITDDDDSNAWGQGGTLEGVEGEVVGFTVVRLEHDASAYHFRCLGAVHPSFRHRHAGRALLISALNSARLESPEVEAEAEEQGLPIYFEALLPLQNPAAPFLAAKCEMQPTGEREVEGMELYRREL